MTYSVDCVECRGEVEVVGAGGQEVTLAVQFDHMMARSNGGAIWLSTMIELSDMWTTSSADSKHVDGASDFLNHRWQQHVP